MQQAAGEIVCCKSCVDNSQEKNNKASNNNVDHDAISLHWSTYVVVTMFLC